MRTTERTRTSCYFFFNDTPTTETYTLSLHDALPIWSFQPSKTSTSGRSSPTGCDPASPPASTPSRRWARRRRPPIRRKPPIRPGRQRQRPRRRRSEEHTSELQSHSDLVCRLLLEKNK